MRDPYDDTYEGPTLHTLSDDERLDDTMPARPLSKVRRWLTMLEHNLRISDDLRGDVVHPPSASTSGMESRHRMPSYAVGMLYLQMGHPDAAERLLADAVPLRDGEPDACARKWPEC